MDQKPSHKRKKNIIFPEKLADFLTSVIGSWAFISIQSFILCIWVILNLTAYIKHWDPYPFILMNLFLSLQAAYAGPIIMMSQNRQNDEDRRRESLDFATDRKAEREIQEIQEYLHRIENKKLLEIKAALQNIENKIQDLEVFKKEKANK